MIPKEDAKNILKTSLKHYLVIIAVLCLIIMIESYFTYKYIYEMPKVVNACIEEKEKLEKQLNEINNNTTSETTNETNNNTTDETNNNTEQLSIKKGYYYKYELSHLFFREDGTYGYHENLDIGDETVGTYEIKNNTIVLIEKIEYGSDACFMRINNSEDKKEATILADGTIKFNNTIYKLTEYEEDEFDKSRYIINPKNGEIPEGWGDPWIDCTEHHG